MFQKNNSDSSPWRAGPLNNLKETAVGLFLKGAGSFHILRKSMKKFWILALRGVREQTNLAQSLGRGVRSYAQCGCNVLAKF